MAGGLQEVLLAVKDGGGLEATQVRLQEHRPAVPEQPGGLLFAQRQMDGRQKGTTSRWSGSRSRVCQDGPDVTEGCTHRKGAESWRDRVCGGGMASSPPCTLLTGGMAEEVQ